MSLWLPCGLHGCGLPILSLVVYCCSLSALLTSLLSIGSTAVDVSQHFPASERRAPVTTLGGSLMASLGVKDSKVSQEPYKGAAIVSTAS
jgi:hypothetical protein